MPNWIQLNLRNQGVKNLDKIASVHRKAIFNNFKEEDFKGLKKLTKCCFGLPLDKKERLSNWNNRPLRSEQLRYAALDAFVLIQIHDYFQEKNDAIFNSYVI